VLRDRLHPDDRRMASIVQVVVVGLTALGVVWALTSTRSTPVLPARQLWVVAPLSETPRLVTAIPAFRAHWWSSRGEDVEVSILGSASRIRSIPESLRGDGVVLLESRLDQPNAEGMPVAASPLLLWASRRDQAPPIRTLCDAVRSGFEIFPANQQLEEWLGLAALVESQPSPRLPPQTAAAGALLRAAVRRAPGAEGLARLRAGEPVVVASFDPVPAELSRTFGATVLASAPARELVAIGTAERGARRELEQELVRFLATLDATPGHDLEGSPTTAPELGDFPPAVPGDLATARRLVRAALRSTAHDPADLPCANQPGPAS
jgi:hypothetical protein